MAISIAAGQFEGILQPPTPSAGARSAKVCASADGPTALQVTSGRLRYTSLLCSDESPREVAFLWPASEARGTKVHDLAGISVMGVAE